MEIENKEEVVVETANEEVVEEPQVEEEQVVEEVETITQVEESEVDKLKKEINELKLEKLNNSIDFMSEEQKQEFNSLEVDLDTKTKMVDFIKKMNTPKQDTSAQASIVENEDSEEVVIKDLVDLL